MIGNGQIQITDSFWSNSSPEVRRAIERLRNTPLSERGQQPSQNTTIQSEKTKQNATRVEKIESELANLKNGNRQEQNKASAPEFNYHTRGTYEGSEVRFALQGEVLDPQDAALYGDVNYIEFGGSGGDYAFKLVPTTTGTTAPQPRIGVIYGEVNKAAPTNIGSLFAPANNGLLWLRVVFAADGKFQSSSIQIGSSLPQNTPTNLHVLIGKVLLQNNAYTIDRQALLGDIIVRRYNICEDGEPRFDYMFVANKDTIES